MSDERRDEIPTMDHPGFARILAHFGVQTTKAEVGASRRAAASGAAESPWVLTYEASSWRPWCASKVVNERYAVVVTMTARTARGLHRKVSRWERRARKGEGSER